MYCTAFDLQARKLRAMGEKSSEFLKDYGVFM